MQSFGTVVRKAVLLALNALAVAISGMQSASAIPELQLYIEGATYDNSDQSWVITANTFILWAIGDVGSAGPISGVHLTAAYSSLITNPVISLTPTTVTQSQSFSVPDPSTPTGTGTLVSSPSSAVNPAGLCDPGNGTVGTFPCLSDGTKLPAHGHYGGNIPWQEFALGDFTLTDSPIGDYVSSVPTSFPDMGQINAYRVTLGGGFADGDVVHFDLFNSVQAATGSTAINAPPSHDGSGTVTGTSPPTSIPEPGSLLLIGLALSLLSLTRRPRAR